MNRDQVFSFNIPFSELGITAEKVLQFVRHSDSSLHHLSYSFLDEFIRRSASIADVKGGFVFIDENRFSVAGGHFRIDGTEFLSQRIITARIRKAESAALFVVTAGSYFEEYSKKLMSGGDVFSGYLVDAAASEIAEAAAEWIERKIDEFAGSLSSKTTSRYSPGYCGWLVGEQHKLFSFLPGNFCGIRITESALMLPIKSVSGIVGIGKNVKKEEYECAVCEEENCFRRNI